MKRAYLFLAVAAVSLMAAPLALAAPPTFDPSSDFGPSIDAYANTLFEGIVDLLPVVLGVAAVFTLLGIAVGAIRKWLGRRKATAVA